MHPDWNIFDDFVKNTLRPALRKDVDNTRSLTHYVESPSAIYHSFDTIAYEKGKN